MKIKSISLLLILVLIFSVVGCNETAYENNMTIAEVSEVELVYLSDESIIVDARGEEAYNELHLKNAICLDPKELLVDKPVPALVAPKAKVERVLGQKGISNDDMVYIYDDNGGVNAFRIWWTMKLYGHEKVKVINGGFKALSDAALKGETTTTVRPEKAYVAEEADSNMIAYFDDVKSVSEDSSSKVKLIDVRSLAEYDAGSIPGAVLYPHSHNLYSDGTLMSSRDIYLFYKDKGIEREDEIVLFCKSSFRATQTMALLMEAGYTNVKVYDGAWIEWSARGGEMATPTDDAPVTSQDGS